MKVVMAVDEKGLYLRGYAENADEMADKGDVQTSILWECRPSRGVMWQWFQTLARHIYLTDTT